MIFLHSEIKELSNLEILYKTSVVLNVSLDPMENQAFYKIASF